MRHSAPSSAASGCFQVVGQREQRVGERRLLAWRRVACGPSEGGVDSGWSSEGSEVCGVSGCSGREQPTLDQARAVSAARPVCRGALPRGTSRGETDSQVGRLTIGILIFQDSPAICATRGPLESTVYAIGCRFLGGNRIGPTRCAAIFQDGRGVRRLRRCAPRPARACGRRVAACDDRPAQVVQEAVRPQPPIGLITTECSSRRAHLPSSGIRALSFAGSSLWGISVREAPGILGLLPSDPLIGGPASSGAGRP